ncbi:MAG: tRNA (guanosine(46)-N7)-methyltransferase TrmB [Acidimicrobiales bacterium]
MTASPPAEPGTGTAPPDTPNDPDPPDAPAGPGWRRSWHARSGRLNTSRQWALRELAPRHHLPAKTALLRHGTAVAVEIGAGSGEAALALAAQHPDWLVVAAEVHTASRATLLLGVDQHDLSNLAVEARDGRDVLAEVAVHRPVDLVRILFPDPWPKRRHHPRRLVTAELVQLLHQSLHHRGVVELATDDADYARAIAAAFHADPRFRPADPATALPPRPVTYYERRARQAGRAVKTLCYAVHPHSEEIRR